MTGWLKEGQALATSSQKLWEGAHVGYFSICGVFKEELETKYRLSLKIFKILNKFS